MISKIKIIFLIQLVLISIIMLTVIGQGDIQPAKDYDIDKTFVIAPGDYAKIRFKFDDPCGCGAFLDEEIKWNNSINYYYLTLKGYSQFNDNKDEDDIEEEEIQDKGGGSKGKDTGDYHELAEEGYILFVSKSSTDVFVSIKLNIEDGAGGTSLGRIIFTYVFLLFWAILAATGIIIKSIVNRNKELDFVDELAKYKDSENQGDLSTFSRIEESYHQDRGFFLKAREIKLTFAIYSWILGSVCICFIVFGLWVSLLEPNPNIFGIIIYVLFYSGISLVFFFLSIKLALKYVTYLIIGKEGFYLRERLKETGVKSWNEVAWIEKKKENKQECFLLLKLKSEQEIEIYPDKFNLKEISRNEKINTLSFIFEKYSQLKVSEEKKY